MGTGSENPGKSSQSSVISHARVKPVAAKAGSFARKFSDKEAMSETQVKIAFHESPGKQTWKGPRDGYTTRSIPKHVPSPGPRSGQDTSSAKGRKQQVKGSEHSRRAEAKPAAGKS